MKASKYRKEFSKYINDNYDSDAHASRHIGLHQVVIGGVKNGSRHHKKAAEKAGFSIRKQVIFFYDPIKGRKQWF